MKLFTCFLMEEAKSGPTEEKISSTVVIFVILHLAIDLHNLLKVLCEILYKFNERQEFNQRLTIHRGSTLPSKTFNHNLYLFFISHKQKLCDAVRSEEVLSSSCETIDSDNQDFLINEFSKMAFLSVRWILFRGIPGLFEDSMLIQA